MITIVDAQCTDPYSLAPSCDVAEDEATLQVGSQANQVV